MALTADQLNTIYQNVLFRNVDQGGIQFFANRQDISDAQVRQQIELSSEASSFVSPIVRLYQEVLGRVPDQGGLRFFQAQLRAGQSLDNVAQQLINSSEFTSKTTATSGVVDATDLSNTNQLVTDAFQSILGRTPAASEFAFFQGRTPAQILAGVAGSSEAASTNAAGVVTFLDSVAQGTYPTGSLSTQTGGTGGAGGNSGGSSFVFAAGNSFETLNGTGGNDTFSGDAANVQATDTVNGGNGTDTVQIAGAASGQPLPTLNSVEVVTFIAPVATTAGGVTGFTEDLSGVTGLSQVNIKNQVGATAATTVDNLTVKAGVAVGLDAVTAAAAVGAGAAGVLNVNITTGSTATSQALFVSNGTNVGTVTLAGAGLTSESVNSSGSASNTIGQLTGPNTITALSITGSQALKITTAIDANIKTVDASANTGGVNLTFGALTAGNTLTVTGGTGNDTFNFGANFDAAKDTVVGGAGTDTISIAAQDISTASTTATPNILDALNARVTGVEVLKFATAAAGGAATVNSDTLTNTGFTKVLFDDASAAADVVTNANSTITYGTGANHTGAETYTLKAGNTTLNLTLEGQSAANGAEAAITTLTVNNASTAAAGTVDTLNVASSGVSGVTANTIGNVVVTAGSTLKVTGSQDLTIGGSTNKITVDASSFTGKLTVTGSAAGDTFTLGSAADTVNVNFANAVAGAGGAAASSQSTYTNLDTINSFTSADTLKLIGAGAGGQQLATSSATLIKFDATNSISVEQALVSAEATTNGTTQAAYFNFGGNTYIVSNTDTGNSATATGSNDLVIKITGVQTLTADANGIHGA